MKIEDWLKIDLKYTFRNISIGLKNNNPIKILGLNDLIKPYFILGLINFYNYSQKPLIFFTDKENKAELFFNVFSYWNNFFSKVLKKSLLDIKRYISPQIDFELKEENIARSKIFGGLFGEEKGIYIFPINSIADSSLSLKEYGNKIIKINSEQNISSDKLINKLNKAGYRFEKKTLLPGCFEKIGGIVNIFPINFRDPVRIELFGDKIESIKSFNLKSKKNKENLNSINICPINIKSENNKNSFILDYLNKSSAFNKVRDKFKPDIILDNPDNFENNLEYNDFFKLFEFRENTKDSKQIIFQAFPTASEDELPLSYKKIIPYQNNLQRFKKEILEKQNKNYQIIIITNYESQFKNLFKDLKNIYFIRKEKINFDNINLASGFENSGSKTILIFDKEILGEEINVEKRGKIDRIFISELNPGDLVVHIDHGIGKFKGTTQREVDEGMREFLIIEYAQGDKLFLPAEYTDKVSKYIGVAKPKINRLHEVSWRELRQKVKKDAQRQALELLRIYALRETSSGFIFSRDTEEQKILENTFEYQETRDQIRAIKEIKFDMEGKNILDSKEVNIRKPMDRIVCGDVGFGKTEIAIRAAFKATQDKKQIALLCPTTILAQQHYATFKKRLENFQCNIGVLSRFKTKKEQKEIIKKLASGKIDIVIGTHRILSSDIKFKDLGLIIIDEEQRFGVRHKEKLKKLRPKVDILTLTATPIPRTLNLALSKLKNISILETPPEGRKEVETYILPKDDKKIISAIRSEIKRNGQVYYLHNRVKTINVQLKRLKKLMPEAKFGIVHGRLSEKEIVDVMDKFNNKKEIDILICSSIIENGLDLPNVNTLIVDNAVMFGLADLHQLRGRIGRSQRKAYAYFFYQSQKLKEKAQKRLEALLSAKELGSGFQIAMQDLEIRGAGNILGKQQSGNIKSVGLNLYCQLLNQAVKEIKTGKKEDLALDITIDLPISAYIPKNFIENPKKRLKIYQSLAKIYDTKELEESKKEILKKNKKLPIEFKNLFNILELKILANNASIKSIDTRKMQKYGDNIYRLVIEFNKIPPYKKIKELIKQNIDLSIDENRLKIDIEKSEKEKLFNILKKTLLILK